MSFDEIHLRIRNSLNHHGWNSFFDIATYFLILGVVLTAFWPVITSGERINFNSDFFQYASRHEIVREGLLKYKVLAQRSQLVGGGFPTIADPEDPTFNPLVLFTLILGTVRGLKWIAIFSVILGSLSLYLLTRKGLGCSRWGALGSALFFGLSLWLPVRIQNGNYNEVYYHFIPACLFCFYIVQHQKRYALFFLAGLFILMLSDGKLTFVASVMYILVLFCCPLILGISLWANRAQRLTWHERFQPLKWLVLALFLTFCLSLFRILPAFELIETKGSLARMNLFFHGNTYGPDSIGAYSFKRLWQEAVAWKGRSGLTSGTSVCIGWIPLVLAGVGCVLSWSRSLPWLFSGFAFAWLAMAHKAPFDLFRYLWELPVLNAIGNPAKYFGCLPVLSVCVLAGLGLDGLQKIKWRWIPHLASALVLIAAVVFLHSRVLQVSRITYTHTIPGGVLETANEFYQVRGLNLKRNRTDPVLANTYVNVLRGIGTIDWYTGIPAGENAVPRYLVTEENKYIQNANYRGECFWLVSQTAVGCEFSPNRIMVLGGTAQADTLIINQNYHRDWRVDRGTLHDWNGLLAIDLPPGNHHLQLQYFSRTFALGLFLSAVSVLCVIFIARSYQKGRFHSWANSQRRRTRILSQTIIKILD